MEKLETSLIVVQSKSTRHEFCDKLFNERWMPSHTESDHVAKLASYKKHTN